MYNSNSYYYPYQKYMNNKNNKNDERLAGGFIFPFLLGGVTGAAVAPAFWNNNNNQGVFIPAPYQYQYNPYQYYYPVKRWF